MGHVVTPDGGRWWMVVAGRWYGEQCWRGEVVPGHTATPLVPPSHSTHLNIQLGSARRADQWAAASNTTSAPPVPAQVTAVRALYPDRGEGGVNRHLDV